MTRQEQKQQEIAAAMKELCMDHRFGMFMDTLRHMREDAVAYAISHDTIKDQRLSLAALGEIRCFDWILSGYEENRAMVQQEAERSQEEILAETGT